MRGTKSLLNDVSVLTFRDTVSEHDDLVGELAGGLLEDSIMGFSHTSEVGDDFPVYQLNPRNSGS